MDVDQQRIEQARLRNLEYIQRLDEQEAERAADEFLKQHSGTVESEREPRKKPATAPGHNLKHTSVYITGLTTYMACKQLEGVCAKIGKVRRIKFYKNERGGLKGDALVTFASHGMMTKAVERLNHFEIKPGVLLTAAEAHFGSSTASKLPPTDTIPASDTARPTAVPLPERLLDLEALQDKAEEKPTTDHNEHRPRAQGEDGHEDGDKPAELSLPSRSVILNHVWDPLAPQDDATAFFTELEEDMRGECGKHGPVAHVHILPTGAIMVQYETLTGSIQCLKVMHGRWFDGRQIEAQFDPCTPEEPEDDDTKLDAFFASLG